MSELTRLEELLERYSQHPTRCVVMADRIAELEAAVERVLALHEPIARDIPKCVVCKNYDGHHVDLPCPTLRALEVGRE